MQHFNQFYLIKDIISQIKVIRENFEFLTTKVMRKNMKYANKQLQDTLMNYFLENYVSPLLKEKMKKQTSREVRNELLLQINPLYPKYISLLNNFEAKIIQLNCQLEYERLLKEIIKDQIKYDPKNEKWPTHIRKQIVSVMLYIHWIVPEKQQELCNFSDIWQIIYPENPLPYKSRCHKQKIQARNCIIEKMNQEKHIDNQPVQLDNQKNIEKQDGTNNKVELEKVQKIQINSEELSILKLKSNNKRKVSEREAKIDDMILFEQNKSLEISQDSEEDDEDIFFNDNSDFNNNRENNDKIIQFEEKCHRKKKIFIDYECQSSSSQLTTHNNGSNSDFMEIQTKAATNGSYSSRNQQLEDLILPQVVCLRDSYCSDIMNMTSTTYDNNQTFFQTDEFFSDPSIEHILDKNNLI